MIHIGLVPDKPHAHSSMYGHFHFICRYFIAQEYRAILEPPYFSCFGTKKICPYSLIQSAISTYGIIFKHQIILPLL